MACLVISPNRSLTPRGAWGLFGAMFATQALIVGLLLWFVGAWPVLPFAGLELIALGWALWHAMRANRYREVLRWDAATLTVEKGHGRPEQHWRASRRWVRVALEHQANSGARFDPLLGIVDRGRTRLWLRASGRACELGRCLTESERRRLAVRLRERLAEPGESGRPTGKWSGSGPEAEQVRE